MSLLLASPLILPCDYICRPVAGAGVLHSATGRLSCRLAPIVRLTNRAGWLHSVALDEVADEFGLCRMLVYDAVAQDVVAVQTAALQMADDGVKLNLEVI